MTMRLRPHTNGQKAEAFIFVLTVVTEGAEMYYASGFSDFKMNALYDRVSATDMGQWSMWLCAESDPNRDKLLRTTNPANRRLLAPPTQNPADDQQEHRPA
jgi:hypothetical protein